ALSTLTKEGHPFGSLVAYAGAQPVLLLSELAEHTQNLRADARASLLVTEAGESPLAIGRVTLLGRCRLAPRAEVEARYLAVHPDAAGYLAVRDFPFGRLDVESGRWVGGFGRMGWLGGDDWRSAEEVHE